MSKKEAGEKSEWNAMRLFHSLTLKEFKQVANTIKLIPFKEGEVVIHEGDPGTSLYIVESGKFTVHHWVRGKERELGLFKKGDHFGEVSFLDRKPRSATIYALENSALYELSQENFRKLGQVAPVAQNKILDAIIQDLCAKLRNRVTFLDFELSDLLPVSVFEISNNGEIVHANRNGLLKFEYSDKDFEHVLSLRALIDKTAVHELTDKVSLAMQNHESLIHESRAITRSGKVFPVQVYVEPILKKNRSTGARVTMVDISDRKQMEDSLRSMRDELEQRVKDRTVELRKSEERYALSVRGANDGLWDWNLQTNEIYFSPRWKSMIGLQEENHVSNLKDWFRLIHPDDVKRVRKAIQAHRKGLLPHLETEYRLKHQDGSYLWILCRGLCVRDSGGKAYRMAGSQSDITERKKLEQQLIQNAFYDSLTGLPNRVLFLDRLNHALARSGKRGAGPFGVLCLDLDRFKNVNDSLGHPFGDRLLVEVAKEVNRTVRPIDTVSRLGGDEFVVLLEDLKTPADAIIVVQRILDAFGSPFKIEDNEIYITASIGVVIVGLKTHGEYETPEEILRDADLAMYRAKEKGKACFEIYDHSMLTRISEKRQLESDMRKALERNEYQVFYQPIVSLKNGKISGFEALVRWFHPDKGIISPNYFIPQAEETGIIVSLGKYILNQACQQAAYWNHHLKRKALFVSVNVSGRQLSDPDFASYVAEVLKQTKLPPECLKLEITESVMIEKMESVKKLFPLLRSRGIQMNLDDFGTGYSSLSCLQRFPFDTLKVDGSFVQGISRDPDKLQIVSSVIALARNLQMSVVAEGVEQLRDLAKLRSLNCDYAQGFHFSEALNAKDVSEMIQSRLQW